MKQAHSLFFYPTIFITLAVCLLTVETALERKAFSDDWPMFRGDQRQLGVATGSLPDSLSLVWRYKTGDAIVSTPVVSQGRVYIGSTDGFVYALDFTSGHELWKYETQGPVEAPPMVVNDSVYIGSTDGIFYSLKTRDGSLNWKIETDDKIVGSANWAQTAPGENPVVVFGSYDGFLYGVDSLSGKEKWQYESQSYINGSPVVDKDRAIVGGCDAMIHSVSIRNGTAISVFEAEAYIAASVAFDGRYAYVGHYGNRFICVDLVKQQVAWEYKDRQFPYFSSAAVYKDFVVFGARDRRVHCVDRKTGKRKWVFPTRGKVDSSPVICEGEVFVGSDDGRLYRINLADGKEIRAYEIGAAITGSPAIADSTLIIGAEDGVVYAFGPKKE